MISYIRGQVAYIDADRIILDHEGIGYGIYTSANVLARVRQGQDLLLYTYLHVREDALLLYGFPTRKELDTFKILLSINKVGPKAALAVLSTLRVEDLYYAVFSDDEKAICRTPGIGPKMAKKMILELKDKLDISELEAGLPMGSGDRESAEPAAASTGADMRQEAAAQAVEALLALGYSNSEAYRAVRDLGDISSLDTETVLSMALKRLL